MTSETTKWLKALLDCSAAVKARELIEGVEPQNLQSCVASILETARIGWSKETDPSLLIAAAIAAPEEIRERALLALLHITRHEKGELFKELLLQLVSDTDKEPLVKVRGRKHWIRIILEPGIGKRVELLDRAFGEEEDEYIRERISAAASHLPCTQETFLELKHVLHAWPDEVRESLFTRLCDAYYENKGELGWVDEQFLPFYETGDFVFPVPDLYAIRGYFALPFPIPLGMFTAALENGQRELSYYFLLLVERYMVGNYFSKRVKIPGALPYMVSHLQFRDHYEQFHPYVQELSSVCRGTRDFYLLTLYAQLLSGFTQKGTYLDVGASIISRLAHSTLSSYENDAFLMHGLSEAVRCIGVNITLHGKGDLLEAGSLANLLVGAGKLVGNAASKILYTMAWCSVPLPESVIIPVLEACKAARDFKDHNYTAKFERTAVSWYENFKEFQSDTTHTGGDFFTNPSIGINIVSAFSSDGEGFLLSSILRYLLSLYPAQKEIQAQLEQFEQGAHKL
jgi:hypothetical protein